MQETIIYVRETTPQIHCSIFIHKSFHQASGTISSFYGNLTRCSSNWLNFHQDGRRGVVGESVGYLGGVGTRKRRGGEGGSEFAVRSNRIVNSWLPRYCTLVANLVRGKSWNGLKWNPRHTTRLVGHSSRIQIRFREREISFFSFFLSFFFSFFNKRIFRIFKSKLKYSSLRIFFLYIFLKGSSETLLSTNLFAQFSFHLFETQ